MATASATRTLTEAEKLLVPEINHAYFFAPFADEVGRDILEHRKIILTGHAGTGKTSCFEQIAARLNQPVMRVNMNGQTTISDFVGFWTVKGGETVWVDGVLPMCMRNGYWCIVDEIDFAEAQILSVLNPVAEKNGKLFLKEKGHEIVQPHEHFRLLATANTVGIMEDCRHIYQGANIMNRALLDRFRIYHVDYLKPDKEAKVLRDTVKDIPEKVALALVKIATDIRDAFNKEELASTFTLRQLIDFAELLVRKRDLNAEAKAEALILEAAEVVIYSKVSREDGAVIEAIIQRISEGSTKKATV